VCECLDAQPQFKACRISKPCQADADCCTVQPPAGFTCDDYPYNYRCVDGVCGAASCTDESECLAYLASQKEIHPSAELKGCEPVSPCAMNYYFCKIEIPSPCETDADCCPDSLPAGYTCDDSPYLYRCQDGSCTFGMCDNDSQCTKTFEESDLAAAGYENLGCANFESCYGQFTGCQYVKPCTKDADCCQDPLPPGYTCDDYPYRVACEDGICTSAPCTADSQCTAYYESLGGEQSGYILEGCK